MRPVSVNSIARIGPIEVEAAAGWEQGQCSPPLLCSLPFQYCFWIRLYLLRSHAAYTAFVVAFSLFRCLSPPKHFATWIIIVRPLAKLFRTEGNHDNYCDRMEPSYAQLCCKELRVSSGFVTSSVIASFTVLISAVPGLRFEAGRSLWGNIFSFEYGRIHDCSGVPTYSTRRGTMSRVGYAILVEHNQVKPTATRSETASEGTKSE